MSEHEQNHFEADATRDLMTALERIRSRLHEATVNAPPQIYQAIEELKQRTHDRLQQTEQKLSEIAHELGETEDDLLEWLKLDIRSLEQRLLQSLLNASDDSRVELKRWLSQNEKADR